MNIIRLWRYVVLIGPLLSPSGSLPDPSQSDSFIEWAAQNAAPLEAVEPGSPFDDLEPLKKIVGRARVVCLGESRHDVHEHFLLKHRLIEFLVEEMGFTLFALEESLPCGGDLNDYILGGEGDPETLLNSMGAWFIWDRPEMLALVKWMRRYNDHPDHKKKIRFYGMDIMDPLPAIKNVLAYLEKVDPKYRASLSEEKLGQGLFSANIWTETMENYRRLPAEEADALKDRIERLLSRLESMRSEYAAGSSEAEFDWISRQAVVLKQANDLFTAGVRSTFQEAGDIRERAMADNLRWILNQEGQGERLIVWAHNFHVIRDAADLDIPGRPPGKDMISVTNYLGQEMGRELVAFGFSFNKGDYPSAPLPPAEEGTVDWALSKTGMPLFILDLRAAPDEGPVHDWLSQKRRMRGEGGFAELVPRRAFDAIIFTETITPTIPNPLARKRFKELGSN